MSTIGIDSSSLLPLSTSGTLSVARSNLLASLSGNCSEDVIDRPGSGDYSRVGCDSLYPSGLWETATANLNSNLLLEQANELYMNRNLSVTSSYHNYSDKLPIIGSNKMSSAPITETMNMDDETSIDFLNRTFPKAAIKNVMK